MAACSSTVAPTNTVGNDTWELTFHSAVPGTFSRYGVGCPGGAGVPRLDALAGDRPYSGERFRLEVTGIGSSIFQVPFGIVGFSKTSWQQWTLPLDLSIFGFPGCTAYAEPFLVYPLTNRGGVGRWELAIPSDPALVGQAFYVQPLVLDPAAPGGGIALSNAGEGSVGRR